MSNLVLLADGKTHLRVSDANSDAEIQTLCDTAEGIVLEYLDYADYTAFDTANNGKDYSTVIAATKLVLTNLYDNREDNPLSDAAMNLLRRWRAPVIG